VGHARDQGQPGAWHRAAGALGARLCIRGAGGKRNGNEGGQTRRRQKRIEGCVWIGGAGGGDTTGEFSVHVFSTFHPSIWSVSTRLMHPIGQSAYGQSPPLVSQHTEHCHWPSLSGNAPHWSVSTRSKHRIGQPVSTRTTAIGRASLVTHPIGQSAHDQITLLVSQHTDHRHWPSLSGNAPQSRGGIPGKV